MVWDCGCSGPNLYFRPVFGRKRRLPGLFDSRFDAAEKRDLTLAMECSEYEVCATDYRLRDAATYDWFDQRREVRQ